MLDNERKGIKISGEKILAGQKTSFSYEYDEGKPPVSININTPINMMNENGNAGNGYFNFNVIATSRSDAKNTLMELVNGIFTELDSIMTNF